MRLSAVITLLLLAAAGSTVAAPEPIFIQNPEGGIVAPSTYLDETSHWCRMADDFQCNSPHPVVAIAWWGREGVWGFPGALPEIFRLSFYTDHDAWPVPGSLEPIHEVLCGDYSWEVIDEASGMTRYYHEFYATPFEQMEGTTYWLSIVAMNVEENAWGWWQGTDWGHPGAFWWWGNPTEWDGNWSGHSFAFVLYGDPMTSPIETRTWGAVKALYR